MMFFVFITLIIFCHFHYLSRQLEKDVLIQQFLVKEGMIEKLTQEVAEGAEMVGRKEADVKEKNIVIEELQKKMFFFCLLLLFS
jgi:hypothetical protein